MLATLPPEKQLWYERARRGEHKWQKDPVNRYQAAAARFVTAEPHASPRVVRERGYDAHAETTASIEAVRAMLGALGVEHVELPRPTTFWPLIVIAEEDTKKVLGNLSSLSERNGWSVRLWTDDMSTISRRAASESPGEVLRITCMREVVGPNGFVLSTERESVTIEPWERLGAGVPRVDGREYIEGTLRRRVEQPRKWVEYLEPEQWTKAQGTGSAIKLRHPHIYDITEPIDIVYTWVDGDDPEWQKRKLACESGVDVSSINETALSTSRFASRDELLYSLRSVEYYASWVNRIYIVTDRQVPEWLNIDHPKIEVIDHSQIFRDQEALPVFNSHAIESQLHHIEGLSENFLYLNDDVFFMRPVSPDLFYTSNGLAKFFPSTAPLDLSDPSARDLPVLSSAKRGRALIESSFGRTVTNKFQHTPKAMQKSVLEEMEGRYPDIFQAVARSRFRHPDDYSIPSALACFYAYCTAKAVPGRIGYAYCDLGRPDLDTYLYSLMRRLKYDVLCLNDTQDNSPLDEQEREQIIADFLSTRFPIKSQFER